VRRRVHAFEFEDESWFPAELRGYITDLLHVEYRVFRFYQMWSPLIARVMRESGEHRIVDLCSGGGGPAITIAEQLRRDHGLEPDLTLTDRYPNRTALTRINAEEKDGVRYLDRSVDATRVPEELGGIRTIFAGFHHMPREAARSILEDAHREGRCICIFEMTRNSVLALLTFLVAPLIAWCLTPLTRPLTLRRLLLTYVVPVVPFLLTWDGMASNLRTYSVEELRGMTADLQSGGYRWESGYLRQLPVPYAFPYLIGVPETASGDE